MSYVHAATLTEGDRIVVPVGRGVDVRTVTSVAFLNHPGDPCMLVRFNQGRSRYYGTMELVDRASER